MGELRYDGRVAAITGAGRGIGRAHALLLASRGAAVVVNDLGGDSEGRGAENSFANDVVAEIVAAGGRAVANHASVADEAGARSIVESAIDAFGQIDILVNNAGIYQPRAFEELTVENFRHQWEVHALGTIMTSMAAWPHMVEAGYGRIVNTGSGSMYGIDLSTDYGSAKGAVLGFTLNLAADAAPLGIQVNCVFPGGNTRLMAVRGPIDERFAVALRPELVSPVVAYLAHESCTLNGEIINTRAGYVAYVATYASNGIHNPELTLDEVAERIDEILDLDNATRFPARNFNADSDEATALRQAAAASAHTESVS